VVARWRQDSPRGHKMAPAPSPPSKRGRKDDVCDSLCSYHSVKKQDGALVLGGCYTPGKNKKWWALSLLQNVESNVPTPEVKSLHGDRSISEYERALGFQPGSNMVSKAICVEYKKKRQWRTEMFKINHFHTAF
jgi:hypothetical protein